LEQIMLHTNYVQPWTLSWWTRHHEDWTT